MSPLEDDEDLALRRQLQTEATDSLKNCPGFAKAQAEAVDEIVTLYKREPQVARSPYSSEERARLCMKMLDIRAAALIKILPRDNVKMHEAFVICLQATRDALWGTWSDLPLWAMFQIGKEWREAFDYRIAFWGVEGYRRISEPSAAEENKPTNATSPAPKKHRTIIEANSDLLKNIDGTLSRLKAAEALGMSPRNFDRIRKTRKIIPVGPTSRKRYRIRDLQELANRKQTAKPRDK